MNLIQFLLCLWQQVDIDWDAIEEKLMDEWWWWWPWQSVEIIPPPPRFTYQLDSADATARWWSVACAKRIDKPRRLIFLTSHEYLHATIQTFVCVCRFSYNTEPNISRSSCFQFIGVVYMKTFHIKEPDGLRAVASDPQTKIGEKTTLDKQIPSSRV